MEAAMQLSSSGFSNGGTIPSHFTCDGEDLSPPFLSLCLITVLFCIGF
jgi:phosphatidylethanolamine-binding protein (PEBP) family uncharacterized protein